LYLFSASQDPIVALNATGYADVSLVTWWKTFCSYLKLKQLSDSNLSTDPYNGFVCDWTSRVFSYIGKMKK